MDVGVIGGGIAGLVAAYDLSRAGATVTVLERAPILGGMAGSFPIGPGQEIERYYHFVCGGDDGYRAMLGELGMSEQLRWVTTDMGLFLDGELHTLGDPLSLLRFPHLRWSDKARFAATTLAAKFRDEGHWEDLEDVAAEDWLVRTYGERAYRMLYAPLLESKFQHFAPTISAAWMWARLNRLGNSRSRTLKERIGYLEGGSVSYITALEKALRHQGVDVRTSTAVDRVALDHGAVSGLVVEGDHQPFDKVLCTVPIPHTAPLFAGLDDPYFEGLRRLPYLGVMVVVMRLRHSLSPYYWMNISDARLPMSGVIEATNLNPQRGLDGDTVVYIPQYLAHTDPRFATADDELLESYCCALTLINPSFDKSWVKGHWVHRERFAQPVCQVGFSGHVPDIATPVDGLFLTDSYQLNPHDRAISFSTDLGREAASLVLADR